VANNLYIHLSLAIGLNHDQAVELISKTGKTVTKEDVAGWLSLSHTCLSPQIAQKFTHTVSWLDLLTLP
jgi:hypothetical protein